MSAVDSKHSSISINRFSVHWTCPARRFFKKNTVRESLPSIWSKQYTKMYTAAISVLSQSRRYRHRHFKVFLFQAYLAGVLDLYDGKQEIVKNKERIIVPTTCGTGSEVTNIAVLSLNARGTKKGLAHDEMYGDYAVLIPELLKDLPLNFLQRAPSMQRNLPTVLLPISSAWWQTTLYSLTETGWLKSIPNYFKIQGTELSKDFSFWDIPVPLRLLLPSLADSTFVH